MKAVRRNPLSASVCVITALVALGFFLPAELQAQKAPHANIDRPEIARPEKPKATARRESKAANPAKGNSPAGQVAVRPRVQQQIEKLANMTPEQRQEALGGLPPKRQQQIEQSIERYQQMTPKQRENAAARAEKLQALPFDEQKQVRQAAQALRQLPEDRQGAVRKELNRLRKMTPQDRDARLASQDFKSKFSPAEQDMVQHMGEVLPDPQI